MESRVTQQALPANTDVEKIILGAILLNDQRFGGVGDTLKREDFMLDKHGRIFTAMAALYQRGSAIDYVTVAQELQREGQLGACDGVTYLVSLNEGLPNVENLDSYVRILQELALRRRGIYAAQALATRLMAGTESTPELLLTCQKTLTILQDAAEPRDGWVTPYEVIQNYPGGPHAFINRPRGGIGIATPWKPVTEILGGGLQKGDLFIVAGRPSMGKSIVGMQVAHRAALDGHAAAFFSLEMSTAALTERLLCGLAGVDYRKLRAGYLNEVERDKLRCAGADLKELPVQINNGSRCISRLSAELRKLRAKMSIEIVVIDHLQLMNSGSREVNRHHELSGICHELKHEALKNDLTIVLLSQLNRECEIDNRHPQLSDLKETGSLEEDGDVVLFVHRPERYAKNRGREDLRGIAEFIIAKQRNGPTGMAPMVFLAGQQRFECQAEENSK